MLLDCASKAVEILEAYEGTLEDDHPPENERCEHGEMLLYKISLLEKSGLLERALEELHKKESKIVDKLAYKEQEWDGELLPKRWLLRWKDQFS